MCARKARFYLDGLHRFISQKEYGICYELVNGSWVYVADGHLVDETNGRTVVKFGLRDSDLKRFAARGQGTMIAQFYELVIPGLILARHVFRGLERPLYCDSSNVGDKAKLVYTWKPEADYEQVGGPHGRTIKRDPPVGKVFAVIVSPNIRHAEQFPQLAGWIEHWNWLEEDRGLDEAPVSWVDRYAEKLWTRET